jgi:hypothetical protein
MSSSSNMCSCGNGSSGICPCDKFVHPQIIANLPGRDTINYRVGDYVAFREALLRNRPGEVELLNWRPGAQGDLAVQMVEWWAYLSDILTFYNERIANEDYLRTAILPESVQGLIRLLGYRPRPGIGATGTLAALMTGTKPLTLPIGFQIQSKPGPGKQPQIFELGAQTIVQKPDIIVADPPDNPSLIGSDGNSVLVSGAITSIKAGAELLIVKKGWNASDSAYAVIAVTGTAPENSPRGGANTRITVQSPGTLPATSSASKARAPIITGVVARATSVSAVSRFQTVSRTIVPLVKANQTLISGATLFQEAFGVGAFAGGARPKVPASTAGQSFLGQLAGANASDYRLQRSNQSARLWQYFALSGVLIPGNNGTTIVHLDSITRQIHVGDWILFDGLKGTPSSVLAFVTSYTEAVFYVNPGGSPKDPATPPAPPPAGPIPIPITHSVVGFRAVETIDSTNVDPALLLLRYAWQDAATLIGTPSTTLSGTRLSLRTPLPPSVLPMTDQEILIGDANGNGADAAATASIGDPLTVGLSSPNGPSDSAWAAALAAENLQAPLSVLFDLLKVSRGKTVANEVLGSGNATITTGQEFVLQKSPLTYLQSSDSTSGVGYKSTLQVWVDGVQWKEVPSFFAQVRDAHIFVTREDENNLTHVQFGDGVNGARLPSGVNNVVATYRYGSGAESPDPGTLTVILKSWPGLKSILNPVPPGGGADPDPPQQIKQYAPQSVLTFGRAVSADDYQVIAAQAPGVARARSYWTWDDAQQRMLVKVYVGDDQNAVSSATRALAGASDPNRPLRVIPAQPVPVTLSLTLVVDPAFVTDDVTKATIAALVDPDDGLLGTNVIKIGQSIFESQIYQACLKVAGVMAVHNLMFAGATGPGCACCASGDYRFDPGEGGFFSVITPPGQIVSPEVGNAN